MAADPFVGLLRGLNEAFARLEKYLQGELPDDQVREQMRNQLVQTTLKVHQLARQIHAQSAGPSVHAVVLGITPEIPAEDKAGDCPDISTKVLVTKSRKEEHQEVIGLTGYVLTGADPHGDVIVALENGDIGFFNVGFADREREISLSPEQNKRIILSIDGRLVDVLYPDDEDFQPGDIVRIEATTNAILGKVTTAPQGSVATVKRIMKEGRVFVRYGDTMRVINAGRFYQQLTIGRQVLVDTACQAVIEDLGDPETDFHLTAATGVSWEDIGGLEEAKQILQDTIDLPQTDPELFRYYHGEVPRGVILIGPPGGGKGMLADAYATALGKFKGEKIPRGFLRIKGPEILKGIVGEAEELIRDIFAEGNRLYDLLGYCVVFIDEIDAVGKKRGTGVSTDVMDTIVPALLTELNSFKGMFIAATNRVDILDPALIRSGRIDLKIVVPRPDQAAAEKIFRVHLRNIPVQGIANDELATFAAEKLFSSDYAFFRLDLAKKDPAEEGQSSVLFVLGHISSGAMIKAIVNAAKRLALKRDLAAKTKTGITKDDISEAIRLEFEQNIPLDHTDAAREFGENLTDKVIGVHKLRQGIN